MQNHITSAAVRSQLINALQLDLIGPTPEDIDHAEEILDQAPSKWYLTGFLVPHGAPLDQRRDDTVDEDLDLIQGGSAGEDENVPEKPFAQKAFFPSSMGLSFLIPENASQLNITVQWGDYFPVKDNNQTEIASLSPQVDILSSSSTEDTDIIIPEDESTESLSGCWKRIPREAYITVPLLDNQIFTESKPDLNDSENLKLPLHQRQPKKTIRIPDSNGLDLVISIRAVTYQEFIPAGTCSVSVFLVNNRHATSDKQRDISYTFQTSLIIHTPEPLVPRPNLRGRDNNDWDENVADLQYRDDYEYAVGHNVSAISLTNPDGNCHQIQTAWIPTADVEKVIASPVANVELGMEALANASTPEALQNMLSPMIDAYTQWIQDQRHLCPNEPKRLTVALKLLERAKIANQRIDAGIKALNDPHTFTAFRIANRAIARYIRQRATHGKDITPESVEAPKWRPFQLAFLLMNLTGIAYPETGDRELVDLLFFPTGGGKTEAYLGLAAFTLVLRRLRYPGIKSAGLSVLMRYTLRLLTLDQLGRAAAMICALEIERQNNPQQLGTWPFEIGLWVGQAATPNRMGKKGDKDDYNARKRTLDFQKNNTNPSPIPLENCPWCGTKFDRNSFQLYPHPDNPTNLRVFCANRRCHFRGDHALPIVAVDEPIYRRLPCFIISTVDKFASLPWVGETGTLFGKVDRYDQDGFYGPTQPGRGRTLGGYLAPPDLIIQDELHLISGPLGTMVGLYETAIDALCTQEMNGAKIRPKIVASTATVRRANKQIQALFGRSEVDIFPPPGPDRRDSFFAKTVPATVKNARTYVGIAAQGRSLKVVLLRTYLALLGATQKHWLALGGKKNPENPADPYMTLLGYFNSLRELGGSRRIVEDEVKSRLMTYGQRLRINESTGLFANRKIADEPEELTSRVSTSQVAETKRRMESTFAQEDEIDVVLATNMISVGLDITRLGLMVVLGQPKTAAEYIQATSRVGRDEERPGLVVTLLNIHRPRDRSHYERFGAWHSTFYRAVEATSVTPFSPRAIDRGIAAITIALARLGHPGMTAPTRAFDITQHRGELEFVVDTIAQRAEMHDKERSEAEAQRQKVRSRVKDLLDDWENIASRKISLQYQREVGEAPPLIFDPLDPELENQSLEAKKFKAQRSLRDVEPTVNLWVINPYGKEIQE
jgi:hypothetical protein